MARKIAYSEPADYFPKSVRKELGLGEFAAKTEPKKTTAKKPAAKKATKKK